MAEPSSILILTACTKLKAAGVRGGAVPAERLYIGAQHRRLMAGVHYFRATCSKYELDLKILSAGYGVLAASRRLRPYEKSFVGLSAPQLERQARALQIPTRCRSLLAEPHSLILLLLGASYLRAASLDPSTTLGGPTIAFGGTQLSRRLDGTPLLKVVAAGPEEARRFSCGLVGLKGELAARLLRSVAQRPELVSGLANPGFDVLELLSDNRPATLTR